VELPFIFSGILEAVVETTRDDCQTLRTLVNLLPASTRTVTGKPISFVEVEQ
jgi:hypothetical protein